MLTEQSIRKPWRWCTYILFLVFSPVLVAQSSSVTKVDQSEVNLTAVLVAVQESYEELSFVIGRVGAISSENRSLTGDAVSEIQHSLDTLASSIKSLDNDISTDSLKQAIVLAQDQLSKLDPGSIQERKFPAGLNNEERDQLISFMQQGDAQVIQSLLQQLYLVETELIKIRGIIDQHLYAKSKASLLESASKTSKASLLESASKTMPEFEDKQGVE